MKIIHNSRINCDSVLQYRWKNRYHIFKYKSHSSHLSFICQLFTFYSFGSEFTCLHSAQYLKLIISFLDDNQTHGMDHIFTRSCIDNHKYSQPKHSIYELLRLYEIQTTGDVALSAQHFATGTQGTESLKSAASYLEGPFRITGVL